MLEFRLNDGGRLVEGYHVVEEPGDCVVRSIAIATSKSYDEVVKVISDEMEYPAEWNMEWDIDEGVSSFVYGPILAEWGWKVMDFYPTPTTTILEFLAIVEHLQLNSENYLVGIRATNRYDEVLDHMTVIKSGSINDLVLFPADSQITEIWYNG